MARAVVWRETEPIRPMPTTMGTYEEIEHTADYRLLLRGTDLRDLLQAAGDGFLALVSDEQRPAPVRWVEREVSAEDGALLVRRAVQELLYALEEGDLPVTWEALAVTEDPPAARVRLGLVPLDQARDHLHRIIKAVTYHDLRLEREGEGLRLVLTFDT